MQFHLFAVGKKIPAWIKQGFNEYNKRLPAEFKLELHEITPVRRGNLTKEKILRDEAKRIRSILPDKSYIVTLDEKGKQFSSNELSKLINKWKQNSKNIAMVIGSADGIDPELKKEADMSWSLSRLTLPHALVSVIIAEQIYRAWTILNNHPYHRS